MAFGFGKKKKGSGDGNTGRAEEEILIDLVFDPDSGSMSLVNDPEDPASSPVHPAGEEGVFHIPEEEEGEPEAVFDAERVDEADVSATEEEEPEELAGEDITGEDIAEEAPAEEAIGDEDHPSMDGSEYAEPSESEEDPVSDDSSAKDFSGDEEISDAAFTEKAGEEDNYGEEADGTEEPAETGEDLFTEEPENETDAAGKDEEPGDASEPKEEVTDKVKSDKLDTLVNEKDSGGDYAANKLIGLLGVSRSENAAEDKLWGLKLPYWGIIILAIFLVDSVLFNFVAYKVVYPLVGSVMKAVGIDGLKLDSAGTESLYTIISYSVAFILGGLAVLVLCKLAEFLMDQLDMKNTGTLVIRTLLVLMALFLIIGLIVMIVNRAGLLTLVAYRWICPFLVYAGGMVFFLLSKIGRKKA